MFRPPHLTPIESLQAVPVVPGPFSWLLPALAALAAGSCSSVSPPSAPPVPFVLEEATIAGIHTAFASGALTCRQLVTDYLARIEAYDDDGPAGPGQVER